MGGVVCRSLLAAVVIAALAMLVAVRPWSAEAGHVSVADGRDTDGRLDVRRAAVFGRERPRWKVDTYRRWRARAIWDRGFVLVWLDTFGDGRFDYYALVRSGRNRMKADLFRDRRHKADRRVATLRVWRKNRRSVSVRIPFARLRVGPGRAYYTWSVQTLFTGPNCRRTCFDTAPDRGAVTEILPGVVPTPTESPTPTPEPTPTPTPTSTPPPGGATRR